MPVNDGYSYRHVLDHRAIGQTTLTYLEIAFPHSSAVDWQARLDAGEVRLDDRVVRGPEALRPGLILVWDRPGWEEPETPRTYDLIHRDDDLIVVAKPSGLPTLPGAGFLQNTLLHLVRSEFPEARPLHRLGRATSGLVMFARNTQSAAILSQRWPEVRKHYHALAAGVASQAIYDIQMPIGPQHHPRMGAVHAASASGKPAHSVARPLQRRADTTVFEVELLTGRPHQIRIHLAFIGHPLVGDPLYAPGGLPRPDNPGLPGDAGYFLHARRLQFSHPRTGQRLDVTAPLPEILVTETCGPPPGATPAPADPSDR